MNIEQLQKLLKITNGTLTLGPDTLPNSGFDKLLKEYNGNDAIVISSASETKSQTQITVTGKSSLLSVNNVDVEAIFALDKAGNPTVNIKYSVIGQRLAADNWTFVRSFPDLPVFQKSATTASYLQILLLSNTFFVLSTVEGVDSATGKQLQQGLNFISDLGPHGISGVYDSLLSGIDSLDVQGAIHIPQSGQSFSALPADSFPWQASEPVPGINLMVDLGIDIHLSDKLILNDCKLRIYSPTSADWLKDNSTWQPVVAVTGSLDIPGVGVSVELVAYVDIITKSSSIVGFFKGVNFGNLTDLAALGNGGGLLESLPQVIQNQVSALDKLTLEKIVISLTKTPNSAGIGAISMTVDLPGVSWTVVPDFEIADMTSNFLITAPFDSSNRKVNLMLQGTITIAGTPFSVTVHEPKTAISAEMQRDATIHLNSLFKTYLPQLPAPPDLTIDTMSFNTVPGDGSYQFLMTLADSPAWTLEVTPVPLTISDVRVSVTKDSSNAGGGASGEFSGSMAIGHFVNLDASYTTPGDFMVRSTLPELNASDLIPLVSNIGISLPDGFDFTLDNNYILIQEQDSDLTLSVGTQVKDFGLMVFTAQKSGDKWGFGFGMEIQGDNLGDLPGLAILSDFANFVGLEDLLLVVSSVDNSNFSFPDTSAFDVPSLGNKNITLPSQASGLVEGLNVYAKLNALKSQGLQTLGKFLGIKLDATIGITLSVSIPSPEKNSKLFLSVSDKINSDTTLTGELGVLMQGGEPGAFLQGNLATSIQSHDVTFVVEAVVVENGAFISGTMKGSVSFDPVTLSNLAVVIGIDLEGIPSFGIAATLDVSSFDSSIAVFFDSDMPSKSMLSGAISNLSAADVVTDITGGSLPSVLESALSDIAIKGIHSFSIPASAAANVAKDLDNRNLSGVSAAFKQYGSVTLPSDSNQVLLRVNEKGQIWSITDMSTMLHYTLNLSSSGIAVDLEAQLYIAPQATNIGALSFPEGYHVFAEIEFLLIDDQLEMEFLPQKGLAVLDQLNEIVVGSKDFLVIKAASDTQPKSMTTLQKQRGMQQKSGPELLFCTFSDPHNPDPNFRAPALKISGEIDFLGLTDSVLVEYKNGKFEMDLDTSTPLGTSFDISAWFNSVSDMGASGNATLGLKHPFGISGRGSFLLDDNVHASLGFSVSGDSINASASFGITILGESLNTPSISLSIDGKALDNIAEYAIDALKDALDDFFSDALKWLKAFKNGLIEGFKDLEDAAKVLGSYFKAGAKAAASLLRAAGYAADEVLNAIKGAFDILEKDAKDIVDFVYNSAAGCAQATGLSSL